MKKITMTIWLGVLLSSLAACAEEDGALCNEECGSSDDCASGYICIAVGSLTNRKCVPEECQQCVGTSCAVTPPSDGECSFHACM